MAVVYCVAAIACLFAATWCYRINVPNRQAINAVAAEQGLLTPERMWPSYDANYLNAFIAKVRSRQTADGKNSLERYTHPTLLWIDVGFAVFCGAFAALFWLTFLEVLPDYRFVKSALLFLIAMSVMYGVIDVGEDLWLARLFSRDAQVSKFDGFIACALTETKIVTISLSVVGGALFKVLDVSFSRENSKP